MSTATTPAAATAVRTYQIDKSHSEVTFQVRHLLTKVRGRFSDFAGTIQFNAASPDQSAVAFTVQTASIDTNEPDRDTHLRTGDFFLVDEHPTLTFRSARIQKTGDNEFNVIGDLTLRGITREITLPMTFLGTAKDPWGNERIAFEGETTLNRKEFGLNWNAALETGGFLVGDEVKVSLSIQAVAAK